MVAESETIVAIGTAPGRAGIGIVRVSGARANPIARAISGKNLSPRQATYAQFKNEKGDLLDRGIALYYPAPSSYTGEDVLELQGHGSPLALSAMLECCLSLGARMARPGEFTERAFLNGKLDLAQAEAVIDLIEARSGAAARAAVRSLDGGFSNRAHQLVEQLVGVRVYIEAALDFSEEEVDFLADGELQLRVEQLQTTLHHTLAIAEQGRLLHEGITIVISGAPNVGKSSLLNQLVGHDAAIIAELAGTTRDVLREQIQIDGLPVNVVDTAGLRDSDDPVEREGIRRAREEIKKADRVLLICEIGQENRSVPEELSGVSFDTVVNKIDLLQQAAKIERNDKGAFIYLSAKTGEGVELLKNHIKREVGYSGAGESTFIARRRHVDALRRAGKHIKNGLQNLSQKRYPELAAEDFTLAQQSLQAITGEYTSDDLLGQIFSSFCIGK
jgi:tRNA modification GTPase